MLSFACCSFRARADGWCLLLVLLCWLLMCDPWCSFIVVQRICVYVFPLVVDRFVIGCVECST